ncbi:DNA-directed RNA polymerase III subunit Rpc5 [Trypanosoma melophagium]|uniref:DNA-directed RNA polymerase III subunit Rpc5 n=1 Tax=Trypanosoma melophagium TaxID=715481 RepID=UPI00351A63D9|nr:DNA-directed RNA polymerase III subunit Rpc5 [Trypanosoma melophagium]
MKFGVEQEQRQEPGDGDEVIATYNVYASPMLQHQLHIFQFPLRRKMRPYEASDVQLFATEGVLQAEDPSTLTSSATRRTETTSNAQSQGNSSNMILRPSSRLTMHCRIDTFGSSSFAEPPAEQRQQMDNASGIGGQQRRHSYHYALQSHPFQSRCDYAVGFIVDGGIHLTPVSTIQQFTPIIKPTSFNTVHRVGDAFVSAPSMAIVPGLTISDRINREMLRQRSVMLNTDADTAKELQYFPINSVESMAMRRRLWSPVYDAAPIARAAATQRVKTRTEDSLFPPELLVSGGITGGEGATMAGNLLRRYADRHSVMDQVLVLLRRCQVLTFAELRELIVPPDHAFTPSSPVSRQQQQQQRQNQQQQQQEQEGHVKDEQLLEALREVAVWMHGVWVSKTAPCFKGPVAALREVILLYFFESPDATVKRANLNALVKSTVLKRTVKEVLESVSSLNKDEPDPSKRVWRLWHVPSSTAAREAMVRVSESICPQEITFQRMQWEKFKPYIMSHLNAINAGQSVPRLLFTTRRNDVGGVITNITGTVAAAAAAAATTGGTPTSFKEEDIAPIVGYIRRLFLEHGVLNKQRAKELVMKAKQQHYPDATNPMLSAALQRCVQPFTNATWVLKTLGEPEVDRHRPLILETVLELVNFETRAFHALLEEKQKLLRAGSSSGDDDHAGVEDLQKVISRVLSEVAVYKQHERLWHLKSGNVIIE